MTRLFATRYGAFFLMVLFVGVAQILDDVVLCDVGVCCCVVMMLFYHVAGVCYAAVLSCGWCMLWWYVMMWLKYYMMFCYEVYGWCMF